MIESISNDTETYESLHRWSRYEEDDEFLHPKVGLSYQYDSRNDTHYSNISSFDLSLLISDTEANGYVEPYYFLHFCDKDLASLKKLLAKKATVLPVEVEDMSYVAMTQRYSIENRKIGDLLFSQLLKSGYTVEDIIEELSSGAYPEVEEGEYPHLRRSLRALEKKATKGGLT
jgi:hypothetical protein